MEDHLGQYTHQTYWGKENQNQRSFFRSIIEANDGIVHDDVPESKIEQHW